MKNDRPVWDRKRNLAKHIFVISVFKKPTFAKGWPLLLAFNIFVVFLAIYFTVNNCLSQASWVHKVLKIKTKNFNIFHLPSMPGTASSEGEQTCNKNAFEREPDLIQRPEAFSKWMHHFDYSWYSWFSAPSNGDTL